ncbi:hypothetical protein LIER_38146 [Lithospermum erythrorhizon]|uniref:Uncharacterized protein n=1 Tax=Lithospermum erythrorhizon TaxID=34254 RepID=A0AAV3PXC3_LITER
MEEDESIASYINTIKDIPNESFLLRKTMSNIPKKFAHKVTIIKEAQDIITMRVDELMGNLTTFEMTLDDKKSTQTEPHVDDSLYGNIKDEEDMNEEKLLEDCKLMHTKWTELIGVFTKFETEKCKLKRENEKLLSSILIRDEEIQNLYAQLKYHNKEDLPQLNDILLLEGLTANLISISQLDDDGILVNWMMMVY